MENDIVIRQYLTKDLLQKFTVMIVDSVGVDISEDKKSNFFIGYCVYGDIPKQNEVLDFIRVGNMSNRDRDGAVIMSTSDLNSPNINILSELIKDASLLYPVSLGVMETSKTHPKDILFTSGFINSSANYSDKEFTFMKSSADISGEPYSSCVSAKIDQFSVSNNGKYVLFFEAKSTSNINTECKISDISGLRENFKSQISIGSSWKKFVFFFDIKEEFYNNYFQIAPFGKSSINTNISLRNISITSIDSLSQYFNNSKTVVGNLDGRYDNVLGKLSGYGVYSKKLIATEGAQIVGSLSVGDENGSNNAFYVGKVAKNRFANSTLWSLDGKKFQSLSKLSEILATKTKPSISPIGKCISLTINKLESENTIVEIPIGVGVAGNLIETLSFYHKVDGGSWVHALSKVHVDEKTPSGTLVKTNSFTDVFTKNGWLRFSETIYKTSYENHLSVRFEMNIKSSIGSFLLGGFQIEEGENSTIYQETGDVLSNNEGYAFWASLGGIGGTIQNPLLKFYEDGSIGSIGDGFKINQNGDAIYKGEFIIQGVDGDKTIVVGGYLNTDIIDAKSISASKIKVDELKAELITVDNIQGLELNFTKGTIGGWSIELHKLSSFKNNKYIQISPDEGIGFEDTLINKFGFKVTPNGDGELGYGVISWNANGVSIGEGASLNASSIKAGVIDASVISVVNLNAGNIVSGKLSADFLSAGTIDASIISVINLNASNITSGVINANLITAGSIDASVVNITNINASNIKAGNIVIGGAGSSIGELVVLDSLGGELAYFSKESRISGWVISDTSLYKKIGDIEIEINSAIGISSFNVVTQRSPFSFYIDGSGQVGFDALRWTSDGSSVSLGESVTLHWGSINSAAGNRFTQITSEGIYTGVLSANQINAGEIDASIVTVKNINASNISSGEISSRFLRVNSSLTVGGTDNGEILIKDSNNNVTASLNRDGIKIGNKTVQDYVNGEIDSVQLGGRNYLRSTSLDRVSRVGITDVRFINPEIAGMDICISLWIDADQDGYLEFYPYLIDDFVWDDGLPFIYYKKGIQKIVYKTTMKSTWKGLALVHAFALGPKITWAQKIEIGNKPSDWSIAPEDVEEGIQNAESTSPVANARKEFSMYVKYIGNKYRRDVVYVKDSGSPTGKSYYMAKIDAGEFSGVPTTDRTKWESIGAQFESMATGLALIDQAIIDNLVTRMLSTSESGPRVQIMGSLMTVFGQYSKNIELGVDDSGMAVLKYFSNNGDLLYNLGPRGIDWGSIKPSSWTKIQLVNVISNPTDNNNPSWYSVNDVILNLPNRPGSDYWKYFAGSNPEVTPEEKEKEKYLYVSQSTSSLKISDGWYCSAWNNMYEQHLSQNSGQYIKPDGENGIYENINGVVDLTPIYTVQLTLYRGGKIVRNANVYWSGAKPQ
ncbi:MAG: hypothetical protein ACRDD8_11740 [Bacteroidales bacterium]